MSHEYICIDFTFIVLFLLYLNNQKTFSALYLVRMNKNKKCMKLYGLMNVIYSLKKSLNKFVQGKRSIPCGLKCLRPHHLIIYFFIE